VIVVVLGTIARRQLAIYGGPITTPELAELGSRGTIFEAHRGTSNLANGAVASMLTGLLPRDHGVEDSEATLGEGVPMIAEAARSGGVMTGMFTANPTTSAPFGFARGFETFVARSPNEDSATAVFEDASRWLDAHKDDRFLMVVHARGGHPPWDATAEETKDMAPAGYTGSLEPKHAGESLAKARRVARLFADADRERAYALHARAIAAHDAALGKLLAQVKALGRDKDTLVLVTSDVGVDAAAHVPFLEEDPLEEAALALPLVVKTSELHARVRVGSATSGVDVARTILEALGLPPAPKLRGEPLWVSASRPADAADRPLHAASATRFSVRWGGFVLVGAKDREVRLCNLALDRDCVSDVRATHPLASELMHGVAFDELVKKEPRTPSPRVVPDDKLPAALRAWGR
jgi:arylsulfatase A-like enzyme